MLYNITEETLAIIPSGNKSKIIEVNKTLEIEEIGVNIVSRNCILNGSSLDGRQKSSAYLIGTNYKPPIIISELKSLILFPTHSDRNKNCIWLNLNGIIYYKKKINNAVTIEFINHQKITINVSYSIFDKQFLRATRLSLALRGQNYKKFL